MTDGLTKPHPKKLMQLIYWSYQEVIGYKVIIRLDRMIHRIIQGKLTIRLDCPVKPGNDRHPKVASFCSDGLSRLS